MMRSGKSKKGFTLIELLVVIAIIGILAAIAIPMYRQQAVKAKLSEVTISMGSVASAVASHYTDNGVWPPPLNTPVGLRNTLGVDVPIGANYINSAATNASGAITFTIKNTNHPNVDGNTLTLTPDTSTGGVDWVWSAGANFPEVLRPKN